MRPPGHNSSSMFDLPLPAQRLVPFLRFRCGSHSLPSNIENLLAVQPLLQAKRSRSTSGAQAVAAAGDTAEHRTDSIWTPPDLVDAGWGIYNFKAVLAYKGTAYRGWQIQNGKSTVPTVQQKVEKALTAVKKEDRRVLRIQGAGRTDAGVHARGQVINFYTNKLTPPTDRLVLGVNANLPADIRVTSIQRVPPDFSARYSSLSKLYSFSLQTGKVADPFLLGLSQHVHKPLDIDAMRQAAACFIGTHDFTQFSSIPAVRRPIDPVKTVTRVDLVSVPGGLRCLIDGSGFLYNQCRHMVGCLLSVGWGTLTAADVSRILEAGSKEHPGLKYRGWALAAAEGLFLEEVRYPSHADYSRLLYPSLPHDAYGRVWLDPLPEGQEKEMIALMKQAQPVP